jgi:hypothetical protein
MAAMESLQTLTQDGSNGAFSPVLPFASWVDTALQFSYCCPSPMVHYFTVSHDSSADFQFL